ncbi:MAG: serine/threonine protein kinase [Polyangiaceae bacterium]|nr:serine/threonine protein kinase [Polyangiaceae bacterium]
MSLSADESSGQPLAPGIVVGGKFTLLRLIAQGGVGSVYEAEDALIGRKVALKLLHPHYSRHAEITRRFLREAQATASIDHPNVVTVLEMGIQADGTLFIVQELLRGESLRQRLANVGRIGADEALQIALPIADALAAAHRRGIVHRDIKPDNIVLARNSSSELSPKLVDFGVAKMPARGKQAFATLTGTLLGTTAYMSPEQARGDSAIDGRADVWGLAAVLFEALSGRCPYDGPTEHAILVQILTGMGPPPWPSEAPISAELLHTIRLGLERDLEKRPTMQAFRDRLWACFENRSVHVAALRADPTDARVSAPPLDPGDLADIVELAQEDFQVDEEGTFRGVPTRIGRPRGATWVGAPTPIAGGSSEIEWRARDSSLSVEQLGAAAEDALRINALSDAVERAESALLQDSSDKAFVGRMRLTQAIANYWLGHYVDSESQAAQAMESFEPGTTGWFAALGHVAMAAGHRGNGDRLAPLAPLLLDSPQPEHPARTVAACRLLVQLARTGSVERARRILQSVEESMDSRSKNEPFVRAWMAVARAELAIFDGDAMRYLDLVKEAVDEFVAAGDIRNASLQRSNIGNALLQLGGYKAAERVLSEAFATAEPMRLSFAAGAQANLGLALARTGQTDEAIAAEKQALARFIDQGNRRFEAVSRLYLALIYTAAAKSDEALESAQSAVEAAATIPGIKAYALAVLANVKLTLGQTAEGVDLSEQALTLLQEQLGVEEGEAWIRFVNASATAQSGDIAKAKTLMEASKTRLLERAGRITDSRFRDTFLRNIPENAQTLAFAKLWGK